MNKSTKTIGTKNAAKYLVSSQRYKQLFHLGYLIDAIISSHIISSSHSSPSFKWVHLSPKKVIFIYIYVCVIVEPDISRSVLAVTSFGFSCIIVWNLVVWHAICNLKTFRKVFWIKSWLVQFRSLKNTPTNKRQWESRETKATSVLTSLFLYI